MKITTIQNGERNKILHVFIDDSGEIVDGQISNPDDDGGEKYTLKSITYALTGFKANLKFEYLQSDTFIWVLPEGISEEVCFDRYSGIKDRNGLDGSGRILIDTVGIVAGDKSAGSLIIHLTK